MKDDAREAELAPDLCIIGAGAAGLSVATAAAALGVSTALVEKGDMGGDRLHAGCLASKALIAAADRAAAIATADAFGVHARMDEIRHDEVMSHVRGVIARLAPNDSEARFAAMGVRVVRAEARFLDHDTLEAGGVRIRARRFVLAVGSRPAVPPIPGLDDIAALTPETTFSMDERPRRLLVLGAGPVGLELGQAFRRLGSETIILDGERALPHEDPEMAAVVVRRLRREGVDLREHARVVEVGGEARGVTIVAIRHGVREEVEGSHLLLAGARQPDVEGLDLPRAGVAASAAGIVVDAALRTANRRIYAIGDCVAGQPRFAHAAHAHAGLALRAALFRLPVKLDPSAMPRAVFTDPEIAATGLSEAEARAQDSRALVLRWPFAENDRAQAEHATEGHVKLMATRGGRILGVAIAGRCAAELLPFWSLAIAQRMRLKDIAGLIVPYPTYSESSKRAALHSLAPLAQSRMLRGALSFMRRFG